MSTKVIVGISGGVDSSVAAYCLLRQGYDVHGVFMKNWEGDDNDANCPIEQDYADARAVCAKLGIPLTAINFAKEYWDRVFSHFLQEYQAGRTPNPDILCNKEIKFRAFLDYAKAFGADFIATGHYARIRRQAHNVELLKGVDHNKDQSYFLHALNQTQLAASLFPIGEMEKVEVRKIAHELGLITHDKKDSTGICFIGERRFKDFLSEYVLAQPGDMISVEGQLIGQHDGLMYYTLGQRQGLKIGGMAAASALPWYVVAKKVQSNQLIVAQGHDHPAMLQNHLQVIDMHWISGCAPDFPYRCTAKARYRQADQACVIQEDLRVMFDQPQRAITPGQYCVFYQDEVCLGGGVIADYSDTSF